MSKGEIYPTEARAMLTAQRSHLLCQRQLVITCIVLVRCLRESQQLQSGLCAAELLPGALHRLLNALLIAKICAHEQYGNVTNLR